MPTQADPKQGTIQIHNHYTDEGTQQRQAVAETIRACIDDGWTEEATASAVLTRLLNP